MFGWSPEDLDEDGNLLLVERQVKIIRAAACLHARTASDLSELFNHQTWKPALRQAGVEHPKRADGFHALRHFYTSVLLDSGESIRALAEYLGHSDSASHCGPTRT